jgi:hypothetical protein
MERARKDGHVDDTASGCAPPDPLGAPWPWFEALVAKVRIDGPTALAEYFDPDFRTALAPGSWVNYLLAVKAMDRQGGIGKATLQPESASTATMALSAGGGTVVFCIGLSERGISGIRAIGKTNGTEHDQ